RSDVGQDVRNILETRNAISQKIEMLEHRIQETVEGTKTTVEEMVDRVKDAADDFVDRTKQTFDPTYQVYQHPWAMVGGAILVGYVLGTLESRMSSERGASGVYPYYPPNAPEEEGASVMPTRLAQPSQLTNLWQDIRQEISGEIEHAKGVLIEVGRSFIHDFFQQALPALGQAFGGGRRDHRSSGSSHESRGNGSEFTRGA
ncbi:MAG: hypothetical protein M3Z35_06190, partial [Nitrospirota bacterium]|nr:hypothetical protein [Nitrospirota bacterium]